mgnify:CR=1 FL=1
MDAAQPVPLVLVATVLVLVGILLTDHNPRATLSVVDRANIIADGRVIFSGSSREAAENELVRRSYLGEDFTL